MEKIPFATSFAYFVLSGRVSIHFVKWSINVNIYLYPSDSTSGPVKSIPTLYHTLVITGSGCKGMMGDFKHG